MDEKRRAQAELAAYGLSVPEYLVLMLLDVRKGPIHELELVEQLEQVRHGRLGEFGRAELVAAVDRCRRRGWIEHLTEEDCARDARRWEGVESQACTNQPYVPSWLEFTPAGAELHRKVTAGLYPALGWTPRPARGRRETGEAKMSLFDEDLSSLRERIERCRPLSDVRGPYRIGPWWVTRFCQAPSGWRADLAWERP